MTKTNKIPEDEIRQLMKKIEPCLAGYPREIAVLALIREIAAATLSVKPEGRDTVFLTIPDLLHEMTEEMDETCRCDNPRETQIYRDLCGDAPPEDTAEVVRVTAAWADALHKWGIAHDTRFVFMACVSIIESMGPAYCKIAAAALQR